MTSQSETPTTAPVFMEERKAEILTLLEAHHKVTVKELSARFGVSTATIRTYLRDLEAIGSLTRTHGGAIPRTSAGFEPMARDKESQNGDLKRAIAAKGVACVEDGDVILIDTGTTCHEFARLLKIDRTLTVLTNDIVIASELEGAETIQVILIGGLLRRGLHCTVGVQGRSLTEGLVVDKAFMGANGFSLERGATTPDINQAATKAHMVSMAHKVFLLCDHTKVGHVSFARFAQAEEIDTLISDDGLGDADRQVIEEVGIEVL